MTSGSGALWLRRVEPGRRVPFRTRAAGWKTSTFPGRAFLSRSRGRTENRPPLFLAALLFRRGHRLLHGRDELLEREGLWQERELPVRRQVLLERFLGIARDEDH